MRFHTFFLLFLLQAQYAFAQEHQAYTPDPDPAIRQRLEEWQDLKFGLLMHWGAYSQWGIVESWSICPEDLGWATGARKPGISDNYNDYVRAYENLKRMVKRPDIIKEFDNRINELKK